MKQLLFLLVPAAAASVLCSCSESSEIAEPVLTTAQDQLLTTVSASETEPPSTVTTLFQGGIGGERNADNPQPEYFVYRFQPEDISVRLSGGTYQVLKYDFSAVFAAGCSPIPYYLDDYDSDGHFDLYAPTALNGDTVTEYAVFIWKPDTLKFEEEPIIYNVP